MVVCEHLLTQGEVMKTHPNLFFTTFLVLYGGFLLVHVLETGFSSWQAIASIFGGMSVAIVAHRKHGFAPSVFLVGHMLIEWYHHALHSNHYTTGEFFFHGIHALLDVVFLYVESKEHHARYALPFLGVVVATLVGIFAYNYVPAQPSFAMSLFCDPTENRTLLLSLRRIRPNR